MKPRVSLLLVVVVSTGLGAQAQPAEMPRAAVLGLKVEGLPENEVSALIDIVAVELQRTGRFRVVTQADVNALVDLSAKQDVLGCDTGDCLKTLSELGGALDVARLVTGRVSTVDGAPSLALQLLDTKSSSMVGRGQASLGSGLEGRIQGVRQALLEALGYSGRIVLWNQPAGATVYLDGRPVGTAPVPAIDVEKPGTYTLQAFHDDHTPWERAVDVPKGAVMRVKVDSQSLVELEADADSRDAWGYGLLGSGALVTVGAGVLWGLAGNAQQQYDGTDFRGQPLSSQQAYTDTILSRTLTAAVLTVIGLGGAGTGLYLLLSNDARDTLDSVLGGGEVAVGADVSSDGGLTLTAAGQF